MTYSAHSDFTLSYWLACRLLALRLGSAHPETIPEQYWLEGQGLIP